jgi:hypothetical protein
MTFYEALKANETKRVRQVGDTGTGYEPKRLIEYLEQKFLDIAYFNSRKWEVVEEPLEFWGVLAYDDTLSCLRDSKEKAIEESKGIGEYHNRIALFREVPGTREEVKE